MEALGRSCIRIRVKDRFKLNSVGVTPGLPHEFLQITRRTPFAEKITRRHPVLLKLLQDPANRLQERPPCDRPDLLSGSPLLGGIPDGVPPLSTRRSQIKRF